MDPIHTPLKVVSAKELLAQLRIEAGGEPDAALSPEAESNRTLAASELSAIFELIGLGSFQWFMHEFVNGPFLEARRALHDPSIRSNDLRDVQVRYLALKSIVGALLEREIAHRELLTPGDEQLPMLREKLILL
jgi:hypothetical protein